MKIKRFVFLFVISSFFVTTQVKSEITPKNILLAFNICSALNQSNTVNNDLTNTGYINYIPIKLIINSSEVVTNLASAYYLYNNSKPNEFLIAANIMLALTNLIGSIITRNKDNHCYVFPQATKNYPLSQAYFAQALLFAFNAFYLKK